MEANSTDNLEAPAAQVEDNAVISAPDLPSAGDTDFKAGMEADISDASATEEVPDSEQSTQEVAIPEPVEAPEPTLYAGKYKDLENFEKGYKELERAFHESNQFKKKYEELESKVAELNGQKASSDAPDQPEWVEDYSQHPLSQQPNPLMEKENHQAWIEKTFTPHFLNDPAGTIQHFVTPVIEQVRNEVRQEFAMREQQMQVEQSINGFFDSKTEWSGESTVDAALKALPEEAAGQFNELLGTGIPPEAAAELVYRRFTTGQVAEQNQALSARDQELRALASGTSNRGPTPGTPSTAPSDPSDFQANMTRDLIAEGVELPQNHSIITKL